MRHIEKRRKLWYAVLVVPVELRETLGRAKFVQSLGTDQERTAVLLAGAVILGWKALIDEARGVAPTVRAPVALPRVKPPATASVLASVCTTGPRLAGTVDDFLKTLVVKPLQVQRYRAKLEILADRFETMDRVNRVSLLQVLEDNDWSRHTVKRVLMMATQWFYWLRDAGQLEGDNPFRLTRFERKKFKDVSAGPHGYIPWTVEQLGQLYKTSLTFGTRKKKILADVILISAFSGLRADELCSMRVPDCADGVFNVTASKTFAGIRKVPIHSALMATIDRLRETSTDGYLFSGLTIDPWHGRANVPLQIFMRLRRSLGYGGYKERVFHSIRKTFVTQLERAGVSENTAADIVGHEKPRITFGLYSGGATLEDKRAAIEKVVYPWFPV